MESLECVKMLVKIINDYMSVKEADIADSEKHLLIILPKLLDYFYYVIQNIKNNHLNEESDKFTTIKNEILNYLEEQGYSKEEFRILEVELFDESEKYLHHLIRNLFFYFSNYKPDINLKNLYYYIFHLIYYIILIIVNSYDKILFEDKNIKFYLYHIIHFLLKDKKSPEFYFFFHEGAFKFLSKKYAININYLFPFSEDTILMFKNTEKINNISEAFYNQILNKPDKNEDELDFIGKFSKIKKDIKEITDEENTNTENLIIVCETLKTKIDNVLTVFKNNKLECEELKKYKGKIVELSTIISQNNLTVNHFALMFINYKFNDFYYQNIETALLYAKEWERYNTELNEDNTEIFTEIINSSDFKKLYLSAMKSSYIKNFTKENKLNENYNLFIQDYANEINKYILYVPLSRGIKAYVSNYFRIALNINSVELIGEFVDKKQKLEVYQSYLLVQFLHESFHFIYRLDKKNFAWNKALSPMKLKEEQVYREIGVDLIFYLFGTEYITYFSLDNCKLLNNLDSWTKEQTNFKVFNKVYLDGSELKGKDDIKYSGLGLKCNISLFEDDDSDFYICNDASIKYCF